MAHSDGLRVLLVEDRPEQARLVQAYLDKAGKSSFRLVHAGTLSAGLAHLDGGDVDIVLLDLMLPDSEGLETFRAVRARATGVPVVILSGLDDEEIAVQAVREGAQDYLLKGDLDSQALLRAIHFAIERKRRLAGSR